MCAAKTTTTTTTTATTIKPTTATTIMPGSPVLSTCKVQQAEVKKLREENAELQKLRESHALLLHENEVLRQKNHKMSAVAQVMLNKVLRKENDKLREDLKDAQLEVDKLKKSLGVVRKAESNGSCALLQEDLDMCEKIKGWLLTQPLACNSFAKRSKEEWEDTVKYFNKPLQDLKDMMIEVRDRLFFRFW